MENGIVYLGKAKMENEKLKKAKIENGKWNCLFAWGKQKWQM